MAAAEQLHDSITSNVISFVSRNDIKDNTDVSSCTRSSSTSSSTSSTSSTIHTEPGVSEDFQIMRGEYNRVLGKMDAQVAWYLERLIRDGMEVDVIIGAIQETAWAPRPSARYLRAILQRYEMCGIMTAAQQVQDQRMYQQNTNLY